MEDGCTRRLMDKAATDPPKRRRSRKRDKATEQRGQPSVHYNQTEYGGGRREMETVAAMLVAAVTTPKSTRPRQKMGEEGGGTHANRGVKEETRRWRMLTTKMMVAVGHDDGDKRQSAKQCESGVDIDCGCGGGKQLLAA